MGLGVRIYLLQYIKARCGEEVSYMPHPPHRRPKKARTKTELRFVMGIDKEECSVANCEMFVAQSFEQLDGTARLFYFKKLGSDACIFAESPQNAAIDASWQQVKPRQMRQQFASAYLLMSAKRHLPSRERHEDDALGAQEFTYLVQEQGLVHDVFYHVVADYQVEMVFKFFDGEHV